MRAAVHVGQLLQPVPGGIGRYVHRLVDALPGAGVEVATFAAPLDPPEAAPAVSGSGISAMSILLASGGYLLAVLVVTLTAVRTRRARAHTNAGSAA